MHHRLEMRCSKAQDLECKDPCNPSDTLQPEKPWGRSERSRTEFAELVHVRSPRRVEVLRLPEHTVSIGLV